MIDLDCKICGSVYKNINAVSVHIAKSHDISKREYYVRYFKNGNYPKCKCGCGDIVSFENLSKGFRTYVRGHSPSWNEGLDKNNKKWKEVSKSISEAKEGTKVGRRVSYVSYECKNPECGCKIECPPSMEGHKRYCSDDCRKDHRDKKRERKKNDFVVCECEICEVKFKNF